jgi:hypothetical protein
MVVEILESRRNKQFKAMFAKLPKTIQAESRKAYRLWRVNPAHPSLAFKPLGHDIWSVRINQNYRALGRKEGKSLIIWTWIGTHNAYDNVI